MAQISSREDFEGWLEGAPREWAQILATRVALRTLPLVFHLGTASSHADEELSLIYSVFRATTLLWASAKHAIDSASAIAAFNAAGHAVKASAGAYANAASATTATYKTVCAAAYAIAAAADANAVNMNARAAASSAAAYAGDAGTSEIWAAIEADIIFLQGSAGGPLPASQNLAEKSLWIDEQGDIRPAGWFKQFEANLETHLHEWHDDWHIWSEWFEPVSQGQTPWDLPRKSAERLSVRIATQENDFWARAPSAVNAEIAVWLADLRGEQLATLRGEEKPLRPSPDSIFVSFAQEDEAFARWIVAVLDRAGQPNIVQYRDFKPGTNFVRQMQQAIDGAARMIAVLSPAYEGSDHCQSEWAAFYNMDPSGQKRALLPMLVRPTALNGLARQVVYSRLYGLSPDQAKQRVLAAIGINGDVETPDGWPGAEVLNEIRGAGVGVFDVVPDTEGRLAEKHEPVSNVDFAGFSPQEIFEEMGVEAKGLYGKTQATRENQYYSENLQKRAKDWAEETAKPLEECNALQLNKSVIWLLRAIASDVANGYLADHEMPVYAGDLLAYYKRLEVFFPKLKAYREASARDRFKLPSDAENKAIQAVLDIFGDKQSSGEIFAPQLIQGFREVGYDRKEAVEIPASDTSVEARNVKVESEIDATNRILAVWPWIANAKTLLGRGAKSADEIAAIVKKYEKVYKVVAPHMEKIVDYVSRLFL